MVSDRSGGAWMRFPYKRCLATVAALLAMLAMAAPALEADENADSSRDDAPRSRSEQPPLAAPRLLGPLEKAQPIQSGTQSSGEIGTATVGDLPAGEATRKAARTVPPLPRVPMVTDRAAESVTDIPKASPSTKNVPAGSTGQISGPKLKAPFVVPNPAIEASRLKGVQPGTSTLADVAMAWGLPRNVQNFPNRVEHEYALEPFAKVEAVFAQNIVSAIVVDLQEPVPEPATREQLGLGDIEPVAVFNDRGELLGEVFPERGVLLSYAAGEQQHRVTQIVLEPIHPQPFALRAESRLQTHPHASLRDVEHALELDPRFARALWLKGQLLAATGRSQEALPAVEEAVRSEPENVEYRLTRARLLEMCGQRSRALGETKAVLGKEGLTPVLKAKALLQLADQVSEPPSRDYAAAIDHRQEAIALLEEQLSQDEPSLPAVRQLMLETHLGMAHGIAWGDWNRKAAVVPKWLEEAESLASATSASGLPSPEQRLLIGRRALAALAGMKGDIDPTPWVKSTQQAAQDLIEAATDPAQQAQINWDFSLAMFDALQVYHVRSQVQPALRCGALAAECFERAAAERADDNAPYVLGRLYFRIGAVHAVLLRDHVAALPWFNKALPLLKEPAAGGQLGVQGESLVSMAVSFWETGDKPRAVQLTTDGVRWMEQAAKAGTLAETSLAIPYANLSTMHRHLGDLQAAGQFEQLATRSQGAKR
jgi:tetratricopeptide (TPR) repeat protein